MQGKNQDIFTRVHDEYYKFKSDPVLSSLNPFPSEHILRELTGEGETELFRMLEKPPSSKEGVFLY